MDAKLQELCRQAHEDRIRVGMLDTDTKNRTLELAADALMAHEQEILEANAIAVSYTHLDVYKRQFFRQCHGYADRKDSGNHR